MKQKVTDKQLLQAIWLQQLKKTSKGVLLHYTTGGWGLSPVNAFWDTSAMCICRSERGSLDVDLGKGQLLVRIKALFEQGLITSRYEDCSHYFIDSPEIVGVLAFCRDFWIGVGVPISGFTDGKSDNAIIDDFDGQLKKLIQLVIDTFGDARIEMGDSIV